MNPSKSWRKSILACCLAAGVSIAICGSVQAQESAPQTSPEGMQLQDSKEARLVYLMPGANFDKFDSVLIRDVLVEFAKDWQSDFNQDATGVRGRVTSQDMDRMKTKVAAKFKEVFSEELQKNNGYQVVDEATPTTLILRPAILNLQVTAPDLQSGNMDITLVRSAGQMTLYLELWDSSTDSILARIVDSQADSGMGGKALVSNRASNRVAADEILKQWADKLRRNLDAVRATPDVS